MTTKVNFVKLNEALKPFLLSLVPSILPQGRQQRDYWVALNPTRSDKKLGSFKINMQTGQWADYATGDSGGDIISLMAYLYGMRQGEAARYIANLAGMAANDD